MQDYKEAARKIAERRRQSSWYKLTPETDNTFRVLRPPATKQDPYPWCEYKIHRDVGPRKRMVRCGKDTEGNGDCWLCDVMIPKLQRMGKTTRANTLGSQDVLLVQVAKVAEDGSMTGPLVFQPSKMVGDSIVATIFGSKKRDYTDPRRGYNITIHRTGSGKNDTRYGALEPDAEPSSVPTVLLKKLKPFSELKEIPIYSEDKQKATYYGREDEYTESEDKVLAPKKKAKRAVVEPEEDEDELEDDVDDLDDDEEADEDEEDEPPVKKKVVKKPAPAVKKKARPVVEEDEDEDEADDDDDEAENEDDEDNEPAPPPKKKKLAPVPVKKRKPPVEEDDDDEEDELDDEEDDEEDEEDDTPPPPKKKLKPAPIPVKKKKPVVVEEDDEEDDTEDDDEAEDEDEEDDTPPPPKRKVMLPAKKKTGLKRA